MKKIIKIPIVIALVSVLVCSLVLPSFALTSSPDAGYYGYNSPFFVENIMLEEKVFAYNALGGVSQTPLYDDDGVHWGTQAWHTNQDGSFSNFALMDDYDGEVTVKTNSANFIMPSDLADFPVMYMEMPFDTIHGNVTVQCVGTYTTPDNVNHDFDYTYFAFTTDDGAATQYVDTSSSFVLLGIPDGAFVNIQYTMYFDVSVPAGFAMAGCTSYDNPDVFVSVYRPSITLESVDVLSWLPTTIDAFLNVEVFPGVDFGTLLLMVIAVPALFAVLKMLGGGG